MNHTLKKLFSVILCLLMLFTSFTGVVFNEEAHFELEHMHLDDEHDGHDHEDHDEPTDLLALCKDALDYTISLIAIPVSADYEDGVECEYCGGWRYDDWKCDNGDHCGEGADGSCYEEHHCGYCGACDDDHEMCDDCGNCLENCCECDEKCRGCYETSGDVCDVCGEKCSECVDFICDDCGICAECAGNELYCSQCMLCIGCADWICYCGEGCSECTSGCELCYEKCVNCAEDELCTDCGTCFDCLGGEGNYCSECLLCKFCTEYICECGRGCAECVLICEQCKEKCEQCADGGICEDCGVCRDCIGGESDFCDNCQVCKLCVDYVCVNCSSGCSLCAEVCEECGEKCSNCAPEEMCTDCGICRECAGGEGHFCDNCQLCENCAEIICYCGGGCSGCATVCPDCGEHCDQCSDGDICVDCGFCMNCVGESNFCSDCALCITCVEMVCSCGNGCANCATVCMECCEKCSNCSDGEICMECGKCVDCAGSESFCITCGLCSDCTTVCSCGEGCESCADICPDCGEKCSNCADEFCDSCDICRECANDRYCEDCGQCGECTEVCEDCGIVCRDCADNVCEECAKCSGCIDEYCSECGICSDCADTMCESCHWCGECAEAMCVECGVYCSDCAKLCPECEKCSSCAEISEECGLCSECCSKKAESEYGCSHGVCPESIDWQKHYCSEGGHCAGTSSKIEYDENGHWRLCGDGCDLKLNEEKHIFGGGKVTKEASKKADGVIEFSCVECAFKKTEAIPILTDGHTHGYKLTVTEATCIAGGYTTHTCECGHTYTDGESAPVKHKYEYKYNESEHWSECVYCNIAGEKAAHKLGEMTTVKKAGYTYTGLKERSCKICGYTISEEIPMLSVPESKYVISIPSFESYTVASKTVGDKKQVQTDASQGEEKVNEATTETAGKDDTLTDTNTEAPVDKVTDDSTKNEAVTGKTSVTKELLTKGVEQTVPALPTLEANESGNKFDGWVNKTTGEPVKKGDKLTGNIELEPVWKDCGEDKHTDSDTDNRCDECGYILVKEEKKDETVIENSEEKPDVESDGGKQSLMPVWAIALISVLGLLIIACIVVLIFWLNKKKKDNE